MYASRYRAALCSQVRSLATHCFALAPSSLRSSGLPSSSCSGVRERLGVQRGEQQPGHLVLHDLAERPDPADHDGQAAGHRLNRLQRRDKLAYSVRGAGDDEDIEDGVIVTDFRHRHAPVKMASRPSCGGMALERAAFRAVADDQRAGA